MTKLEKEACRRIAAAIRSHAAASGKSINQLAKEWRMSAATLDTLVGSDKVAIAANIPRGATLQLIAQKTRRSLDWLLALSDREFIDQSRSAADLQDDVAAHVKRAIDEQLGPPPSQLGEREEWVVIGRNALQLAVDQALLQAKAYSAPAIQVAVLPVVRREEKNL